MRKRIISLLACGVIAAAGIAGAAGCDNGGGKSNKLTVWGPSEQQATLKTMVEEFKKANPDVKATIDVGVCAEGDANANVSKDPSAAADVYAFANDQIVNLVRVGALAEIGGSFKTAIEENNGEGAVKAGQVNGKQYGYPYAADNGYFLYYDKTVITDEQATTLEGIMGALEAKGKKIGWALDDSWYVAGWFFTFGGSYQVEYNDDGTEKSVTCTFADEGIGTKTVKALNKLVSSHVFAGKGTTNTTISSDIGGSLGAAVTGTWMAESIEAKLGSDYGVAKLPTVTVDGDTKQLSSFAGYKLYGVNPHSKDLTTAHKLAAFLSGEEMQELRFKNHKIGPSNNNVAASDAVKENAALAALAEQNKYAVAQTAVPENFWEPVKGFGVAVIDGLAESEYQAELDKMIALIVPKLPEPPADPNAKVVSCHLVGTMNAWKPTDRPDNLKFTTEDGKIWTLEYTFDKAEEVKVVQLKSDGNTNWSGAKNLPIAEAGTYVLTYDLDADTLTAVKK